MTISPWEMLLAILGALFVGVSKTGVGGLGVLASALFAALMPAKQSAGFVLPLLVFGDLVAVASYRRHAVWAHVGRMFPWTAAGILLGWYAMGRMDDRQARLLIGALVLGLTALQVARRHLGADGVAPGAWFGPVVGVLAGFTTLVANAAGALMAVYLLAMRLPKLEFVGTAAVFFLLVNLFKVPFMVNLGLLTTESFSFNLLLAPAVFLGTLGGRWLLPRLNQRTFENVTLALGALAGLYLLLK
ncbi:MAG: sulfite exporter TauE/SafE family protein [Verrucomicrobiota bacterium]